MLSYFALFIMILIEQEPSPHLSCRLSMCLLAFTYFLKSMSNSELLERKKEKRKVIF